MPTSGAPSLEGVSRSFPNRALLDRDVLLERLARRAGADGSLEVGRPLRNAGDRGRLLVERELALVELGVARGDLPRILLVDVPGTFRGHGHLPRSDAHV